MSPFQPVWGHLVIFGRADSLHSVYRAKETSTPSISCSPKSCSSFAWRNTAESNACDNKGSWRQYSIVGCAGRGSNWDMRMPPGGRVRSVAEMHKIMCLQCALVGQWPLSALWCHTCYSRGKAIWYHPLMFHSVSSCGSVI